MATIRETFFDKLKNGAKWDVGVSINRTNGVPLDQYSVFESETKLNEYMAGAFAYPGQVLALVAENKTTIYYIDQNKELQEVGVIPTGDGKTIAVDENGQISLLVAAGDTAAGSQLTLQADGTIKWVKPDTSTAEGQATAIKALQDTVDGYTPEDGEPVLGLVDKVEVLEDNVKTLQTDLDAVEKDLADNYYDKDEVDGLVSGTFHFKGAADHIDAEGNLWIDAEEQTLAQQVEGYVYQVGDKEYAWDGKAWVELGFNIDLTSYATKAYVGTEIGNAKTELKGNANTDTKDSETITGAKKYADDAANAAKTGAEATAQGYANTAEQNAKGYTDDEIEKLNISQYATTEALNGVKETADNALPKATYDTFVSAEGDFGKAQTDITNLKAASTQHATDISTAQTTANEAKSAAATNAQNIGTLDTTVNGEGGLVSTVANHTTRIGSLEGTLNGENGLIAQVGNKAEKSEVNSVKDRVAELEETVGHDVVTEGETTTPATGLVKKVADLEGRMTAEESKADKDTTYTFETVVTDGASNNIKITTHKNDGATETQTLDLSTATTMYVDAVLGDLRGEINVVSQTHETDKAALQGSIDDIGRQVGIAEGEIDTLQETIKGLSGAMHFKGVVTSDPTAAEFDIAGYEIGDVVIYGNKEYVFAEVDVVNGEETTKVNKFVEFGDATGNASAITALDSRVKTLEDYDHAADHADTLQSAKDYADGLADNYATAEQGGKADTAIQTITTVDTDEEGNETPSGLKAVKAGTNVNISFDEAVVFVFDGGSATSEW